MDDAILVKITSVPVEDLRKQQVYSLYQLCRGERGNPTRKDNGAHIVSHEFETLKFVSLLLPPCVSVPKLYSISREA